MTPAKTIPGSRKARDGGLRKVYRTYLPDFHWQSVETPLTGSGVPDSNYSYQGVEGWIENKSARGNHVAIRREQVAWLERRARAGGRCFIGVRQGDTYWLLRPAAARQLLTIGLHKLPSAYVLGRWPGGPARWDWPKIAAILLSV